MQNEIKIIQNILHSAIKTHKKGVNILFWGDVGTGKTELVKVIANSCKIKLYEVNGADKHGQELSRIERLYEFKQKQEVFKITETARLIYAYKSE